MSQRIVKTGTPTQPAASSRVDAAERDRDAPLRGADPEGGEQARPPPRARRAPRSLARGAGIAPRGRADPTGPGQSGRRCADRSLHGAGGEAQAGRVGGHMRRPSSADGGGGEQGAQEGEAQGGEHAGQGQKRALTANLPRLGSWSTPARTEAITLTRKGPAIASSAEASEDAAEGLVAPRDAAAGEPEARSGGRPHRPGHSALVVGEISSATSRLVSLASLAVLPLAPVAARSDDARSGREVRRRRRGRHARPRGAGRGSLTVVQPSPRAASGALTPFHRTRPSWPCTSASLAAPWKARRSAIGPSAWRAQHLGARSPGGLHAYALARRGHEAHRPRRLGGVGEA